MAKASESVPTTIPSGEAAVITANGMTELELVLPEFDDGDVPEPALFLVACAMRFHQDPDFVHEQLNWLVSRHGAEADEGLKPEELNSSNDD